MSVKVGLISDIHATPEPLREALAIFTAEGVETVLCAGDIAGYGTALESTVALLVEAGCRTILGNHDLWWLADADPGAAGPAEAYLRRLPLADELIIAGKTILAVHGSPPASLMRGIRLLDEDGGIDAAARDFWCTALGSVGAEVLVVGHTHQVFAERLGNPLVVNPGSTRFNHTCAILSLPEMEVTFYPLGGQDPEYVWNWGMEFGR